LNDEIKNNKTLIKGSREKKSKIKIIKIKLKTSIHDKKKKKKVEHVEYFNMFSYLKIFLKLN
jgi:hypothetical protein